VYEGGDEPFARAMAGFVELDSAEAARIAAEARSFVADLYSLDSMVEEHVRLYDRLLNRG